MVLVFYSSPGPFSHSCFLFLHLSFNAPISLTHRHPTFFHSLLLSSSLLLFQPCAIRFIIIYRPPPLFFFTPFLSSYLYYAIVIFVFSLNIVDTLLHILGESNSTSLPRAQNRPAGSAVLCSECRPAASCLLSAHSICLPAARPLCPSPRRCTFFFLGQYFFFFCYVLSSSPPTNGCAQFAHDSREPLSHILFLSCLQYPSAIFFLSHFPLLHLTNTLTLVSPHLFYNTLTPPPPPASSFFFSFFLSLTP